MEQGNEILKKIEHLIRDIIAEHNVPCYKIESEVEHHANPGGEDIFIPVVRITSYFEGAVNYFTPILDQEFDLALIVRSAEDKQSWADGFSGYQAHYMAALKPNRAGLAEYKKWGTRKFEIKLCSV